MLTSTYSLQGLPLNIEAGGDRCGEATARGRDSVAASGRGGQWAYRLPVTVFSIRHLTRYRYRKPVRLGEHRMMFRPLESYDQRLVSSTLDISPAPSQLRYVHDVFGNCVGIAQFATPASELTFESRVTLERTPSPAFAGVAEEVEFYSGTMPFAYSEENMPDLLVSMGRQHSDPDGKLERWARGFVHPGGQTSLQALLADMTKAIHSDFRYATRLHGEAQAPTETLSLRAGTCRDFAMLMMEAVRSLGLAAQFVSGYIYSPPLHVGGLTRVGGGHTHAWVRVYLPACGWVEFDPTNGIVGNADLVRVAIARNPRQALPLQGTWKGEAGDFLGMDVEVEVTCEDDRVATRSPMIGARMKG
ncbi:MAG: transglutaminase domain protein [Rhodospirillales bacterium]|nr:transglutaminase domain protein [Rhodospirillales bacterium]